MSTLVNGFPSFDPTAFEERGAEFSTLMNLQRVLMSACEVENLTPDVAFFVTQLAAMDEIMEALENYKNLSKPWKRDPDVNLEEVKGEVIDQLFFVLQSFVLLGMTTEEVIVRYRKKHGENIERIIRKREGMDAPL